jgi:hypothetical protein
MRKGFLTLVFVCVAMAISCTYLGAQVLEDYGSAWKEGEQKSWFRDNDRLQLELDLEAFPQAFITFEIPSNSVVFFGEKLWFFAERDTVFSERVEVLLLQMNQGKAPFIVFKRGIQPGDAQVKKVLSPLKEKLVREVKDAGIKKRDLERQEIRSFFTFSIFLVLIGASLYKVAYPFLFIAMIRPMSLILAEDFSESGSLQKFFTFDVLSYLLVVNMLTSLGGVLGLVFLKHDWLAARLDLEFESLILLWLFIALVLLAMTILKFIGVRLAAYLFDLDKLEFSHFFYLLRLVTITSAFFVLISFYFIIHDFLFLKDVLAISFSAFFWIYVLGIAGLFLIMMNRLSFKKYHLFAYLCIAELVPFLILSKWIMDIGQ